MKKTKKVFASTMVFVIMCSMLLVSVPVAQAQVDWDSYHRYAEIVAGLQSLVSSGIAEVETIGETYHNIEIKAIKISDNPEVDEADEPDILFVGLHHAREWISAEVPYYLAVNLVEEYDTDSNVRALVDSCEIWVVPVLNPDGYWWSHEYDRYWRKNTKPNSDGTYGVDLDRNYGWHWGEDLDPDEISDGSDDTGDDTYWGPSPFSENETSAIQNLLTDSQHNFQAVLSYHSYSQLILYPWGYTEDPAPDSGLMSTLATEMADLIHNVHGETYIPMQASELYLVSGDLADWVYGTMGIPAFTIELRPESADPWWEGFLLPEGEILDTCEENWPAALFLIRYVCARDGGALALEGVKTWHWVDDTYDRSVASADVDGDGAMEIITGGRYLEPGARWWAQLAVWDGSTLTLEGVRAWYWVGSTYIYAVDAADVDGDGSNEIVTGGWYNDGTREVAQLCVWDGSTLTLERVKTWHWVSTTRISSVAIGDVDGDGSVEIVTGGYYHDGLRYRAQLAVWDGTTLSLEGVKTWHWVFTTEILSVACTDVDGDGSVEIVTGGFYHDGTREVAQLCVWDGATLTLERVKTWHWVSFTRVYAVDATDVDGDLYMEIITGGAYYDGSRYVAQLAVWDGTTLSLEGVKTWHWVDDTYISSVAIADVDVDGAFEIVTGGWYNDGTRHVAQLCVWNGATLSLEGVETWYWVADTEILSVACTDVDEDGAFEIVTGGWSWGENGGLVKVAQLCVWGLT